MRNAATITKQLSITGGILSLWFWSYYSAKDHVVYVTVTATLALYVTMWIFAATAAWATTRFGINRKQLPLIELQTGEWKQIELFKWWVGLAPFLRVECTWEQVKDCEIVVEKARENVRAARRGYLGELVRIISLRDMFGLSRFSLRVKTHSKVRILPARGRPTTKLVEAAGSQEDSDVFSRGKPKGDFLDMRNYRRGESTKRVLWKVVARTPNAPTEKWSVRMEEEIESRSCGIFLIPAVGDEASAELALAIVENSLLGQKWVFGAATNNLNRAELVFAEGKVEEARDIIARSGNLPGATPSESASQVKKFVLTLQKRGIQVFYILLPCLSEGSAARERQSLQATLQAAPGNTQCFVGVRHTDDGETTRQIADESGLEDCTEVVMMKAQWK